MVQMGVRVPVGLCVVCAALVWLREERSDLRFPAWLQRARSLHILGRGGTRKLKIRGWVPDCFFISL